MSMIHVTIFTNKQQSTNIFMYVLWLQCYCIGCVLAALFMGRPLWHVGFVRIHQLRGLKSRVNIATNSIRSVYMSTAKLNFYYHQCIAMLVFCHKLSTWLLTLNAWFTKCYFMYSLNNNNNNNKWGLYTTYLRIWFLIKGVHKNAITMKIYMLTVIKVSITRRSCKISSVLFN